MAARLRAAAQLLVASLAIGAGACMPPSWGANALLHPSRRPANRQPTRPFEAVTFEGAGVKLKGWWFHAPAPRGTVVFLHGVADNRGSSIGIADHFVARGFDVLAYDSRAHGESEGDVCTYGYYEKQDLRRVVDRVVTRPVVLIGFSMGAAVALQEAAEDGRLGAIVAVSPFSDLRTAASERAPFFASKGNLADAFKLAEDAGKFRVDDVSPMAAAAHVTAPTLIIHGDHDDETPPAHALRVFAALHEPKRLIMVAGATHQHVLDAAVWREIDGWLDTTLAAPRAAAAQ
jgi:alpha-beta hydrolase superfamily lysophospholipase